MMVTLPPTAADNEAATGCFANVGANSVHTQNQCSISDSAQIKSKKTILSGFL